METIIFCGIQATGKTTFYKEHFFKTHMRISLDQLNTRNKEQIFINTCLSIQQRFVIDNTNPTKEERAKYIEAVKAYKFKVIGYYFKSNVKDAIKRNSQRSGKEYIPEVGIRGTLNRLEIPSINEGFDVLYEVEIVNDGFRVSELNNNDSTHH
jgi:predicted kinase